MRSVRVGQFILDLLVGNAVVADAKVIDHITNVERGQVLNYLCITGMKVGVILNFHKPRLEWERIIL